MPLSHFALALFCVLAWGSNFVVIRLGLTDLPPLLFAGLRFALVALLAIWLPRPQLPLAMLARYALFWGTLQFGGLFLALAAGLPASISAVLAQSQVVFTLMLSVVLGRESWQRHYLTVILLATCGIAMLAFGPGHDIPLVALLLGLCAAAGWACGNLMGRDLALYGQRIDSTGFVAWASVLPALSLLLLSAATEPWQALSTLHRERWLPALAAVLFQALVALLLGSLAWNRLLRHHPASRVAPWSLLVPVVGITLATLVLEEKQGPLQWLGCSLLLFAVGLHVFRSWKEVRADSTPTMSGQPLPRTSP